MPSNDILRALSALTWRGWSIGTNVFDNRSSGPVDLELMARLSLTTFFFLFFIF